MTALDEKESLTRRINTLFARDRKIGDYLQRGVNEGNLTQEGVTRIVDLSSKITEQRANLYNKLLGQTL